jgi:membrane protein DedA with SNARE-associated domain
MKSAFAWVLSCGYIGVFLLMRLGIVGIPISDETVVLLSAN